MVRKPEPISDDLFVERLGWSVVAMLLAALVVWLCAWYGAMLDIRT